jgi:hypothetical protein
MSYGADLPAAARRAAEFAVGPNADVAILDACQDAWRKPLAEVGRITSIAARDWASIGQ